MSQPDPFPDPTIIAAVGGPWPMDDTVYEWETTTPHRAVVRFQWRERGAVLALPSGTMALADARFPVPPPPPPDDGGGSATTDVRQRILISAESYLGTPYGMPPQAGEVDCSSYVLRVYDDVGLGFVDGVRTAEQIRQECAPIDWDAVQPGDILFFEHTYEPSEPPGPDGHTASHCGISYGAGTFRMINAVEPAVTVTDLSGDYWQEHLFEARAHPWLAHVEPPPVPTAEVEAIDVSNYQEWASDPGQLAAYLTTLDPVPTRVIVRLASYLESAELRRTAIAQLRAASALYPDIVTSLGVYGWCYRQADPQREVDYWHQQIMEAAPAPLYDFWLDVEDEANCPLDSQISWELELLEVLGYEPGIYTGKSFWEQHFTGCDANIFLFPLWIANYSTAFTIDTVPIPAGWDQAQGWQYTSTPCDRNTFRS